MTFRKNIQINSGATVYCNLLTRRNIFCSPTHTHYPPNFGREEQAAIRKFAMYNYIWCAPIIVFMSDTEP